MISAVKYQNDTLWTINYNLYRHVVPNIYIPSHAIVVFRRHNTLIGTLFLVINIYWLK